MGKNRENIIFDLIVVMGYSYDINHYIEMAKGLLYCGGQWGDTYCIT